MPVSCVELAADLSREAKSTLVDFWKRRADGEWTTAYAFDHVRTDLKELNCPRVLLDLADRAVADEHRHTEWCQRMVERLTGTSPRPPTLRGTRPLQLAGASPRENRLLRPIFTGCLSETIAVHVLRESHPDIRAAEVRHMNHEHLAEEVDHARLGWAFLAWAKTSGALGPAERRCLSRAVPALLELAQQAWLGGARNDTHQLSANGFLSNAHIERGLRRAIEDVIVPGFAEYDIELAPT